jgi:hypothetical protein
MDDDYELQDNEQDGHEPSEDLPVVCNRCRYLNAELRRITDIIRQHEAGIALRFFQEPDATFGTAADFDTLNRQLEAEHYATQHLFRERDAVYTVLSKHQREEHEWGGSR